MHCCRRGFNPRLYLKMYNRMNIQNAIIVDFSSFIEKHTTSLDPISILSPHGFSSFQNTYILLYKASSRGSEQHVSKRMCVHPSTPLKE